MIVISGALVLVALVLLILGVVGPDLGFVYASIGVSLVSLVFLVVGILQRRGETAPVEAATAAAPPTPADAADVTAVSPSQQARASMRKVVQESPSATGVADSATVLVVEGRPRYHVEGCRYLSGKSAEAVEVSAARADGFSACGVCRPDEALAAAAQAEPVEEQLAAAKQPAVPEDVPGIEVPPTRTARAAAARKTAARRSATTAVPAGVPAGKAASTPKAAKAPAVKPVTSAKAVKAVKAPAAKAPAAKAPAAKAPAAKAPAPRAGSVVVIPDRGKFHKPACRFVRGVDGTEVMSRTAAGRSGYAACGVCKP